APFLLADHVAEDASEQADVVDQRPVLLGGVFRLRSGRAGHGRQRGVIELRKGMLPCQPDNPSPMSHFIIATRESRLALWQADHVRDLLKQRFGLDVDLLGMTTRGDQILDRTLSKVGGKGLFVKELETALEEGRAHLAVHSLES